MDGLVHYSGISIANTMEMPQSCTKPSIESVAAKFFMNLLYDEDYFPIQLSLVWPFESETTDAKAQSVHSIQSIYSESWPFESETMLSPISPFSRFITNLTVQIYWCIFHRNSNTSHMTDAQEMTKLSTCVPGNERHCIICHMIPGTPFTGGFMSL